MVMKKTLGYIISAFGLAGVALTTFPEIKTQLSLPETISGIALTNNNILITSGILIAIGLFLVVKGKPSLGGKNKKEVPIYEEKEIVGYRRH